VRKFEKISFDQFAKDLNERTDVKKLYDELQTPKRGTVSAAGYDFFTPFSFTIKPREIVKVPTGMKVMMEKDECLLLIVRSSVGIKYNVRMCNQIGLIDSDYYDNTRNEGHMWYAIQNEGESDFVVNKGDRIIQGVFIKYLLCSDEAGQVQTRIGKY
jgi:dUTP pyrophosphatase